ncbi:hypothetical protein [Trujillonella endophytica]|uniref:Uncharacterized protein n=1 Tax=Trujillonella endophytica TaxID=673521 RepID=A0A1H8WGU9_9ACTN|nr:hypothetical protein [Trujillella endophytica]SEP26914.1 hypothetical protein SAMN05660991_04403 [Trujillella endophytica]
MSAPRAGRAPIALGAVGALVLGGCAAEEASVSREVPACSDDDGEAANGVVLMAQAVPSATWVPCVEGVPLGWGFGGLDAAGGSARFWLDSDRDGPRAIEVRLDESCDTAGATEIPTDREGLRRLERVTQVTPEFHGRRFYLFEGGCLTVVFTLGGEYRGEPLALATQGIGVVSRADLSAQVRGDTGGRLELDPPADDDEGASP